MENTQCGGEGHSFSLKSSLGGDLSDFLYIIYEGRVVHGGTALMGYFIAQVENMSTFLVYRLISVVLY